MARLKANVCPKMFEQALRPPKVVPVVQGQSNRAGASSLATSSAALHYDPPRRPAVLENGPDEPPGQREGSPGMEARATEEGRSAQMNQPRGRDSEVGGSREAPGTPTEATGR